MNRNSTALTRRLPLLLLIGLGFQGCIHSTSRSSFHPGSKVDTEEYDGIPVRVDGDPNVTVFTKFNRWGFGGCDIHGGQSRTWFIELRSPAPGRTYTIPSADAKGWCSDFGGYAWGDHVRGTVKVLHVSPEWVDLEFQVTAEIHHQGKPISTEKVRGVERFDKPK
ncbi:MAG TPA: hypothetical protein VJU16_07950 [Planctomycetota bacterium]|nr:hypothetical protein [Planctomycetota bacterium]